MKTKKIMFYTILLFTVVVLTSCEKNDVAEEETLFNAIEEKSVEMDEIKPRDT